MSFGIQRSASLLHSSPQSSHSSYPPSGGSSSNPIPSRSKTTVRRKAPPKLSPELEQQLLQFDAQLGNSFSPLSPSPPPSQPVPLATVSVGARTSSSNIGSPFSSPSSNFVSVVQPSKDQVSSLPSTHKQYLLHFDNSIVCVQDQPSIRELLGNHPAVESAKSNKKSHFKWLGYKDEQQQDHQDKKKSSQPHHHHHHSNSSHFGDSFKIFPAFKLPTSVPTVKADSRKQTKDLEISSPSNLVHIGSGALSSSYTAASQSSVKLSQAPHESCLESASVTNLELSNPFNAEPQAPQYRRSHPSSFSLLNKITSPGQKSFLSSSSNGRLESHRDSGVSLYAQESDKNTKLSPLLRSTKSIRRPFAKIQERLRKQPSQDNKREAVSVVENVDGRPTLFSPNSDDRDDRHSSQTPHLCEPLTPPANLILPCIVETHNQNTNKQGAMLVDPIIVPTSKYDRLETYATDIDSTVCTDRLPTMLSFQRELNRTLASASRLKPSLELSDGSLPLPLPSQGLGLHLSHTERVDVNPRLVVLAGTQ